MALDNAASTGGAGADVTESHFRYRAHLLLTARQQLWLDNIRRCEAGRVVTEAYVKQNSLSIHAMYSARKDLVAREVLRAGVRGVANTVSARFAHVRTKIEGAQSVRQGRTA